MAGYAEPQGQLGLSREGGICFSQLGEDLPYLLLGGSERSRVVDDKIGGYDFFFVGCLCCHATGYLGAGSIF